MRAYFLVFAFLASFAQADVISEWAPNPTGADPDPGQYLELSGTPGAAFSWTIVVIESDPGVIAGEIDFIGSVSGTYDAAGIALITGIPDFENPSNTLVLLSSFTGTITTDIDSDGDGSIDAASLGLFVGVEDAIGTADLATDATFLYADELGGTNMGFADFFIESPGADEPTLIFRDASTGALFQTNGFELFDSAGVIAVPLVPPWSADPLVSSPGAVNPTLTAVPEPTSMALLGLVGAVAALRRRRAT